MNGARQNQEDFPMISRPEKPLFLPWIGALLLLFSVSAEARAQCPAEQPDTSLERYEFPPGMPSDTDLDSREACPSWRWVAIKADDQAKCPKPATVPGVPWKEARALFAAPRPPALEPFCLYEVEEGDRETRQQMNRNLEGLLRSGRLLEAASGCAAVAPSAATPEERFRVFPPPSWKLLHDHFYEQARALPGWRHWRQEASETILPTCGPRVRVAVLDTHPEADPKDDRLSDHGYVLDRMIRRLTCHELGDGSDTRHCAADVRTRLALPIAEFDWADPRKTILDPNRGGKFGTIEQLAVAVWDELETWRENTGSHLVMNLSVGWVGERFGGLEEDVDDMPVPVRALYRAFEVASCRGALVLAASGNRVGGPAVERGPLLPGGWERRSAPTKAECREILGETVTEHNHGDEPLVYAVGGVHADGSRLTNARPDSEPSRVAYADHAVLLPEGKGRAEFFTGSSVSTAVVSATAAVVWHQRPELDRAELMRLLHHSGEDAGRTASVHLGDGSLVTAPPVRIIGLCPAVAAACTKPRACPELGEITCPTPTRIPSLRTDCDAIDCGASPLVETASFDESIDYGSGYCGQESLQVHYRSDDGKPSYPCPGRQTHGLRSFPWTGPQPSDDPCAGCTLDPPMGPGEFRAGEAEPLGMGAGQDYRLTVSIDPEWCTKILSAALVVGGQTFDLGVDPRPCPSDPESAPPIVLLYDGFDAALVLSTVHPKPVIQWRTLEGSFESPVFVNEP